MRTSLSSPARAAFEAPNSGRVYLVEIPLHVPPGSTFHRFALWPQDVSHLGETWTATGGGFTERQESTQREAPALRLILQNVDGSLGALVDGLRSGGRDARRRRITLHETLPDFLGQSEATISDVFFSENYRINDAAVAFEIGNPMAVSLIVPDRTVNPYGCRWRYGSEECGVLPGVSSTYLKCARTRDDCRLRNPSGPLPYGAFPSVNTRRVVGL